MEPRVASPPQLSSDLEPHRRALWHLAYRMTGTAADADDVVQDVFARALTHPPDRSRPLRPWLMQVALNRSRSDQRSSWSPLGGTKHVAIDLIGPSIARARIRPSAAAGRARAACAAGRSAAIIA